MSLLIFESCSNFKALHFTLELLYPPDRQFQIKSYPESLLKPQIKNEYLLYFPVHYIDQEETFCTCPNTAKGQHTYGAGPWRLTGYLFFYFYGLTFSMLPH